MGIREDFYERMKNLPLEKRIELEQPGLWTMYELEDGRRVLVDEIENKKSKFPAVVDGCYYGTKIKKELASTTYLLQALLMREYYEQHRDYFEDITKGE